MTAYEELLFQMAEKDERIVVLTAENRAAIRSLPSRLGERFIDVGICEQSLVGVAAGLALRGRVPVVHALSAFLTMRAFEFIRTDIGYPRLPVILVGGVPGILSDGNGPTHQAIEDISLMRSIPGMGIVAPADGEELLGALEAALARRGPCYIRYYDGSAPVAHSGRYELGVAEVLGDEREVVILTYGMLLGQALEAASLLRQGGRACSVVNVRSLRPLDAKAVLSVLESAKLTVVLEDHLEVGGLASAVSELLPSAVTKPRILPINFGDRWFRPGLLFDALYAAGLTGAQVAERILTHLEG